MQEEVDQAIKEMPRGKAPRSDGFTTYFFDYFWPMIREEFCAPMEESRTSNQVTSSLNATFLTLIPKKECVTNPKQFRSIALSNFIYKIITKVIALKLKPILPYIISKEQSGYVEGHHIMDNIILVHEIIHSLKTTCTPGMLIKLDISKEFDKLSWKYMHSILSAFGFSANWIDQIMKFTSSARFSILVNGVPSRPFSPTRGIYQGDPLSPFLFLIIEKGLGWYLSASIANGTLQGLSIHRLQLDNFSQLVC
jgi:hypothetical protein